MLYCLPQTDTPVLLGVAAVDVPIPDIEKLTSPFKVFMWNNILIISFSQVQTYIIESFFTKFIIVN